MTTLPTISFEKICNNGTDAFPSYASSIISLDGCPDLLHAVVSGDNSETFQVATLRNGKKCVIFEADFPKTPTKFHCDATSISVTESESHIGIFISYVHGSFKTEQVTIPEGTGNFFRSAEVNYFILGTREIGFTLLSSISDKPLITWKEPKAKWQLFHFYNNDFILIIAYDGRCRLTKYVLVNDAYCAKSQTHVPFEAVDSTMLDHFVIFIGSSDLAIFDCTTTKVIRFTFPLVRGDMCGISVRAAGNGLAEIFFSVTNEEDCNIYKASLSLCELAARFEMQNRTRRQYDLPDQLPASLLFGQNACDGLQQKYAALVEENEEYKKKNAELEATVASLRDRVQEQENVLPTPQDAPIESSAQERLEALEKKYNNMLMLISKK